SERMDALVHAAMAVIVNATAAAIPMVLCIFPSHVRIASVPWVANLGRNEVALCEGGHRTTILMDYLFAWSQDGTHHPESALGQNRHFTVQSPSESGHSSAASSKNGVNIP